MFKRTFQPLVQLNESDFQVGGKKSFERPLEDCVLQGYQVLSANSIPDTYLNTYSKRACLLY